MISRAAPPGVLSVPTTIHQYYTINFLIYQVLGKNLNPQVLPETRFFEFQEKAKSASSNLILVPSLYFCTRIRKLP